MKNIILTMTLLITGLIISGCSSKTIKVSTVQPAYIPKALEYKNIAVMPLTNDNGSATNTLEQKLMEKTFYGKKMYNLIDRTRMEDILNEQAFNNSGAVKEGDKIQIGEVNGVDALIFGSVNKASVRDSYFYKLRSECRGKNCEQIVKVRINCTKREYAANLSFKMVDLENSKIVVSKTYFERKIRTSCEDEAYSFLDTSRVMNDIENIIITKFINLISPTEYFISATIAEDEPDLSLSGDNEDMLEEAVVALENRYYEKSEKLFKQVLNNTNGKSYVATYNLGLMYEIFGKYDKAITMYDKCKYLVSDLSDVPELRSSLYRVKRTQNNKKIAYSQVEGI